jgi:glycerol dehydrogenase
MSTLGKYTAAFPGKYIQGEDALGSLPDLIQLLGERGLIIASPTVTSKILPVCKLGGYGIDISTELFGGECCGRELDRLQRIVDGHGVDVLIGMGGGKTIDTAKIVADKAGIPVIIVPTIASTDAPCSGCAVIYSEKGVFQSVYYTKMNPQVVLVDTRVIANAPVRFLVAGMGDALATWFEARSCKQTGSLNECSGLSTLTGLNLARLCYDTLLRYGSEARHSCENHIISPALDYVTEANILLSGIGFESSGLATAHSVHNGLSELDGTHAYYHGEKVAFGVLTGLHLTSATFEEIKRVYSFCESVGLPTVFSDIGINQANPEMLMKVAVKACAPAEGIHHEIVEITPLKVVDAMIAADELGRTRKKDLRNPQ